MNSFVRSVFKIVGTMMVSSILFYLLMGSTARSIVWNQIEPVFKSNWSASTFNDGRLIDTELSRTFDNLQEVLH